jgi:hypothetical protein
MLITKLLVWTNWIKYWVCASIHRAANNAHWAHKAATTANKTALPAGRSTLLTQRIQHHMMPLLFFHPRPHSHTSHYLDKNVLCDDGKGDDIARSPYQEGILRELRSIWPNWMALELPLSAPNSSKTRQISGRCARKKVLRCTKAGVIWTKVNRWVNIIWRVKTTHEKRS